MSIILTGDESRAELAAFRRESMQELKNLHKKAASGFFNHPIKGRIPMTDWDRKYVQGRVSEVEADIAALGQLLGMGGPKPKARNPDEEPADEEPEQDEPGGEECASCHKMVEETEEVSGEEWCETCREAGATRCDHCNALFDTNAETMTEVTDREETVCEECFRELGGFRCRSCGETYSERNQGGPAPSGRGYVCTDCYEPEEEEEEEELDPDGPVEGYHDHTRVWNRFGDSKTRIYYGVELEAISEDHRRYSFQDSAEEIRRKYGKYEGKEFLFTEDDCSLDHMGYETVFHPMSPEFIAAHKDLFKNILGDMVKGHMISYEAPDHGVSAGMHVSVMFNRLRRWERRKLLALIYNNVKLTTDISRRPQDDLDRWARVRPPAPITQMVMKKHGYHAKTVAVNLKRVPDARIGKTIELAEVRIFRGTLKLASFLMNIEYVIACVGLAKDLRYGMMDTTAAHILGYIKENRKTYPNIYAWMKEKGVIR